MSDSSAELGELSHIRVCFVSGKRLKARIIDYTVCIGKMVRAVDKADAMLSADAFLRCIISEAFYHLAFIYGVCVFL